MNKMRLLKYGVQICCLLAITTMPKLGLAGCDVKVAHDEKVNTFMSAQAAIPNDGNIECVMDFMV